MDQNVLINLFKRYLSTKYKIGAPARMTIEFNGKRIRGGAIPIQEKDESEKFNVNSPKPFFIVFVEGESENPLENIVTKEPTKGIIGEFANRVLKGGTLDITELLNLSNEIYQNIGNMPPHLAVAYLMKKLGEMTGKEISVDVKVANVKAVADIGGKKKEFNEESLIIVLASGNERLTIVAIPRNVAAKLNVKQAERWFK